MDEFTRECLAIDVERQIKSDDVLDRLTEVFVERGMPDYIRSDNGSEFVVEAVTSWLAGLHVDTFLEAKVLVERWRQKYSRFRPHSPLGYRSPSPEAVPIAKRRLPEKAV